MNNDEEDNEMDKIDEKDLEIVTGDGSSLTISPVYDHLNSIKPKAKEQKKKKIIIPTGTVLKEDSKTIEEDLDSLLSEDDPEGNKVTIIMDDEVEN